MEKVIRGGELKALVLAAVCRSVLIDAVIDAIEAGLLTRYTASRANRKECLFRVKVFFIKYRVKVIPKAKNIA